MREGKPRETPQRAAIEALRGWSQWLIGVSLTATAGCVTILQGGPGGAARLFLIVAIGSFALALLCAMWLVRILARLLEHLPLVESDGQPSRLEEQPAWRFVSLGHLAQAQSMLLTLGAIAFLAWVIL